MIALRDESEIARLRAADRIVSDTLVLLAENVRPGISTQELDAMAEECIRSAGAVPSFLGYCGYPNSACISVEDVIVHGIPGARVLREGQIVSIDVGAYYEGYHGDAALTVACGEIDDLRRRLIDATDRALSAGIQAARAGNYLVDVSRAVQQVCDRAGFSVVRDFVGHGIGRNMHEEPQVPNFDTGVRGPLLREGMVMALEPMVNAGKAGVKVLRDGWTAVTVDGKPSAHFEHSIVVRDGAPEILSATPRLIWGQR
ncbi:MAG: type I methionyl aminopeptidase [Candidatus Hydrogenedentota bacterium]